MDEMGRELDGTKLQAPNKPDCEQGKNIVCLRNTPPQKCVLLVLHVFRAGVWASEKAIAGFSISFTSYTVEIRRTAPWQG